MLQELAECQQNLFNLWNIILSLLPTLASTLYVYNPTSFPVLLNFFINMYISKKKYYQMKSSNCSMFICGTSTASLEWQANKAIIQLQFKKLLYKQCILGMGRFKDRFISDLTWYIYVFNVLYVFTILLLL